MLPSLATIAKGDVVGVAVLQTEGDVDAEAEPDRRTEELIGRERLRRELRIPLIVEVLRAWSLEIDAGVEGDAVAIQEGVRAVELRDARGVVIDGGGIVRRGGEGIAAGDPGGALIGNAKAQTIGGEAAEHGDGGEEETFGHGWGLE